MNLKKLTDKQLQEVYQATIEDEKYGIMKKDADFISDAKLFRQRVLEEQKKRREVKAGR